VNEAKIEDVAALVSSCLSLSPIGPPLTFTASNPFTVPPHPPMTMSAPMAERKKGEKKSSDHVRLSSASCSTGPPPSHHFLFSFLMLILFQDSTPSPTQDSTKYDTLMDIGMGLEEELNIDFLNSAPSSSSYSLSTPSFSTTPNAANESDGTVGFLSLIDEIPAKPIVSEG
jgi:hypothetical protein